MSYTWDGMRKISWADVQKMHEEGNLTGCFYLYPDGTEAEIESGYAWEDIVLHYEYGGEFGIECED